MSDAALRELAARAASGDGSARAQDRYRDGHHHAGLLHGLFARIADWIDSFTGVLPGGPVVGWLLLAAVVGVVAVSVAGAIRRRRAEARVAGPGDVADAAAIGPAELERRASEAEAAGDLERAVRLRFAAGLLRLDAVDAIQLHPSLTSGAVGRALRSPRYDDLATTHDAIAYGGRAAADEDAASAREVWPVVVGEARRR